MKKQLGYLWSFLIVIALAAAAVFSYRFVEDKKIVDGLKQYNCYKKEKRAEYLELLKNNPEIDSYFIVLMVNNNVDKLAKEMNEMLPIDSFDEEKFSRYNDVLLSQEEKGKQDGVAYCLKVVNNDLDLLALNEEKMNESLEFINEKYFIKKNLKRYLDYYANYSMLSKAEVIKRVNSNIDKKFYSNDIPTDLSKGNLLICNKFNKLEENYVPENLVTISSEYSDAGARLIKEAGEAFEFMCEDAKQYGQIIKAYGDNGYRSYDHQKDLYNFYVDAYGVNDADEISARPGYSEHQSGYAIDVMVNGSKYNTNHQLDWLMANSYKYGFIYRYQENQEYITGYQIEQWHYRFVGKGVAAKIHDEGLTFEEYYAYYVLDNSITVEEFINMFK